jgi:PAS domain S-box-containing protein
MKSESKRPMRRKSAATRADGRVNPAEQQTPDAHADYRLLVENVPYGILVLDCDRRILMANDAAAILLDWGRDELSGKDLLEFLHPDSWETGAELLGAYAENDTQSPIRELAFLQRNGVSLPVDVAAVRVAWLGNQAVLATIREVTKRKRIEDALRKEREQLLTLFDSIDQVIYVTDPVRNEILFVNQHVKRLLGKDPTGGLCFREFQGLDNPCDFCTNDIIMRQRGVPYVWEHHNSALGRDYLITDKYIEWPDGRDVRFEFAMDITERKRAGKALRESEAHYRELVQNLNDIVYAISDSGRFTYIGPAVRSILGYTPEEMIGRPVTEFMSPQDLPMHQQAFAQVIGGQPRSSEYRVTAKDGSVRWMQTSSRPYYENDRITGIWGILSDVTERKRVEEALREREEAFRALAETAGEGIIVIDAHRRALYSNPQAQSMLGVCAEELLGKDVLALVIPEQRDDAARRVRELFGNERLPERDVLMMISSHGRSFTIEIISARTKWFGQEALLLMCHDVTDRLRMEEELRLHRENLERKLAERTAYIRHIEHRQAEFEKLAAVSGLAARMAHEINNPLGGLKNAFLLIKDEISPDAPHAKYVHTVEKEIGRMTRIVRQLYHLCRPHPQSSGSFCVADTLRDVITLLEAEFCSSGVRLEMDVRPPDSSFFGSEDAIRQILFNLIKNAIEASARDAVVAVQAAVEGDGLRLSVSDQGTGIPDDVLPQIFEPFFSTKQSQGTLGLGLGLPVSKSLVEALGGRLDFETTAGEGTVFRVWLPSTGAPTQSLGSE